MTALDRLQGDVERVIAEHRLGSEREYLPITHPAATYTVKVYDACLGVCDWTAKDGGTHAAHVSERVMAMLTEKGLREERALHPEFVEDVPRRQMWAGRLDDADAMTYAKHIEWRHRTRLVTDWRTDTGAADE